MQVQASESRVHSLAEPTPPGCLALLLNSFTYSFTRELGPVNNPPAKAQCSGPALLPRVSLEHIFW